VEAQNHTLSDPLIRAIQECGRDFAERDKSTEQSGIYNFLGTQPITVIGSALTTKLKSLGYEIVPLGQSKTFRKSKTGEK
jgi:phage major head subunit gpT-like protein